MIKKSHKKFSKNLTSTRHLLRFGSIGLKTTKSVILSQEQIFSLERSLNRKIKFLTFNSKNVKSWCLLHANQSVTKLSLESRMGKGKGSIYTKRVFVKPGCILYEFQNINLTHALELRMFIQKQISTNLILIYEK